MNRWILLAFAMMSASVVVICRRLHPEVLIPSVHYAAATSADVHISSSPPPTTAPRPTVKSTSPPQTFNCSNLPDTGPVSANAEATEVCSHLERVRRVPRDSGVPGAFTIIMTTYKGHRTVDNTLRSWKRGGLLDHPKLHEVIFHINRCTCGEVRQLRDLMAEVAVPYRTICTPANRLHPNVMVLTMSMVRTPMVFFSENDRVIVPMNGESPDALQRRVRRTISSALELLSNGTGQMLMLPATQPTPTFESLYREYLARPHDPALSHVVNPSSYKPPPEMMTAWRACYDVAFANRLPSRCFEPKFISRSKFQVPQSYDWALKYTCLEYLEMWGNDTQHSPTLCLIPWARILPRAERHVVSQASRLVVPKWVTRGVDGTVCGKYTQNWSNEPFLTTVEFFLSHAADRMCESPRNMKRSGMVFRPSRKHFGRYGRAMESFLSKLRTPFSRCYPELGLFTHQELESFDVDKIDDTPSSPPSKGGGKAPGIWRPPKILPQR